MRSEEAIMGEILDMIKRNGGKEFKQDIVRHIIHKYRCGRSNVYVLIKAMENSGILHTITVKGRYGPREHLVFASYEDYIDFLKYYLCIHEDICGGGDD